MVESSDNRPTFSPNRPTARPARIVRQSSGVPRQSSEAGETKMAGKPPAGAYYVAAS
jgi:hypothetical protein